ncbi:MAG: hypothetical protein Q9227_005442 [Pyrenula ochraceoflavens]
MAVNAIRNGDCDSAIVAASNWIMDPSLQIALDKLGTLSPTSKCHTFDESADGYARGEGFAALYFKKPSQAVSDGSPIRAVIRGTAVNANGHSQGITRPSEEGQEAVIRKAYQNAGNLPLSDTSYFECHGTGTPVGDPIEVTAVGNVFSSVRSHSPEDRLLVGSVKTNLGHTEGASALAAIMKVVLALEAGVVPPSVGVKRLNPNIDFEKAKVEVVRETVPWPRGRLRRASINSFGFGGANGHCIIDHVNNVFPTYIKPGVFHRLEGCGMQNGKVLRENVSNGRLTNGHIPNGHFPNGHLPNEHLSNGHLSSAHRASANAPKSALSNGHVTKSSAENIKLLHQPLANGIKGKKRADATTRQLVMLPFSAHNDASLQLNVDALSRAIDQHSLADVAYTLAAKRSKLFQRSFRIVDKDDVANGLREGQRIFASPAKPANVGFIFTGQGAQWHAMGAELFEYRVFEKTVEYLDYVLAALPQRATWNIKDILSGKCDEKRVQTPEISQTACTAVQIGLVDLLASWSVRPVGVAGHSSGEMAAAYASGHISAAEAITAAYCRGQVVSRNKKKGAMLAVGLGPDEAQEYLYDHEDDIRIAAINSPGSTTLSGEADAVARLSETLKEDGVFQRLLSTGGNAYHSHHMVALGHEYSGMLSAAIDRIKQLGLCDDRHRYPRIPWISSVTPYKSVFGLDIKASYWRANLESPVRFSEAVSNLVSLDSIAIDVLAEIGPHPALRSPLDQTLKGLGKNISYASSLKRDEDSQISLLNFAGTLFGYNAEIDMVSVNAVDKLQTTGLEVEHGCSAIDLPPYQYSYGSINYHEGRASKEYRLRSIPRHDLVGSRVGGNAKLRPQWRNILRPKDLPWLGEHRLLPRKLSLSSDHPAPT